jgi:hypothetical protein
VAGVAGGGRRGRRREAQSERSRRRLFLFRRGLPPEQALRNPRVVVIVRDRANKVIGGLVPFWSSKDWPPGRSPQRVQLSRKAIPATADLARTEVFVGDAEVDTLPR